MQRRTRRTNYRCTVLKTCKRESASAAIAWCPALDRVACMRRQREGVGRRPIQGYHSLDRLTTNSYSVFINWTDEPLTPTDNTAGSTKLPVIAMIMDTEH